MGTSHAFLAVLLDDQQTGRDWVIALPACEDFPPLRIHLPTDFEGAAAYDVYELIDQDEWPEQAVYLHRSIIPRTTPDPGTSHTDPRE
ncbi:hypothetical protein [Leifsonia sp. LS-T14]|uniref:hypothetical protein n=1 Tax=unclassified Leifsonia TaxID=2663824 RepID=UPI0035A6033C